VAEGAVTIFCGREKEYPARSMGGVGWEPQILRRHLSERPDACL